MGCAGMRLVQNERVKVRLVWVSGDGRDAEYEILERYEQPSGEVAQPVGFEGQRVDREVIEPVGDSELVVAVQPESQPESATEAEVATESAEDYLEKARRQAYAWASGQG